MKYTDKHLNGLFDIFSPVNTGMIKTGLNLASGVMNMISPNQSVRPVPRPPMRPPMRPPVNPTLASSNRNFNMSNEPDKKDNTMMYVMGAGALIAVLMLSQKKGRR